MQIGAPTGGDPGAGGLNIQSNLQLAGNPIYAGIPQNLQNASYQLVLSDANKHIFFGSAGGATTLTIPANASVAFPVGSAITVITGAFTVSLNITTDTLFWLQGGTGTVGNRTLAARSVVTILKSTATQWILTGNGIS